MKKDYIVELSEEEADELMDEHWVGELVRCGDCKHFDKSFSYDANKGFCSISQIRHDCYWFCADGERG